MSILFAVVIIILAGFTLHGYIKGLVRVVFSLLSIFLTIILVMWITPYASAVLAKTPVYQNIQQKCVESIQGKAQIGMEEETENQEPLKIAGIELPKEWQERLTQKTTETADHLLETTGIYDEVGNYVAGIIVNIIACVITFLVVLLVLRIILNMLDLVAKLPVLNCMNHLGGTIAGVVEGVIVIWILFFVITLCQDSELCQGLLKDINQNVFLTMLYKNNFIEEVLMKVIL